MKKEKLLDGTYCSEEWNRKEAKNGKEELRKEKGERRKKLGYTERKSKRYLTKSSEMGAFSQKIGASSRLEWQTRYTHGGLRFRGKITLRTCR